MGETTIEWTEKSWNPIAAYYKGKRGWMCSKPSAGCKNCYSERMNMRLGNGLRYTPENVAKVDWQLVNLDEPGKWRKPALCFVESMGDLFHEGLPDELIERVWSQMLEYPQHTFQVLTKRAARMRELVARFTQDATRSADHIWLGVSVENQEQADKRIPELLKIPARVRFLSCEPLLGPLDLSKWLQACSECGEAPGLDWRWTGKEWQHHHGYPYGHAPAKWINNKIHQVIVGGESGPGARPMHPDWARSLRDQCQAARVPFFFKQWGEWIGGKFDYRKSKMVCGATETGKEFGRIFWTNPGEPKVHLWDEADHYWTNASACVGKKAAGRLLDGREWDEMPGV